MERWSRWLRTPRGLQVLLTTVVALPAAALVFLGTRLLQQDRDLARQRRAEILEEASNRAVRALEDDLASLRASLSDPLWPSTKPRPGIIHVLMTAEDIRVNPPESIAYWPAVALRKESGSMPFRELEDAEFRGRDLRRALTLAEGLTGRTDPSVQAGALVRQARILRKMGRSSEALPLYDKLARITSVAINGLPADLQARKTRCVLLAELSRQADLGQEAAALRADLDAGAWPLDRSSYEYVSGLVDGWLGGDRRPATEREMLAAGVDWIRQARASRTAGAFAARGTHVISAPGPLTVVWESTDEGVAAFLAGPTYFQHEWLAKASRAASPAQITLLAGADGLAARTSPQSETLSTQRRADETGLPWTLAASLTGQVDYPELESRRRLLFAGLAAVLMLVAAGTYVIVRSRNSEMMLARLQSDFVTAVSHEFRTPLTALRQFNELLDDGDAIAPEKRRSYHLAQTRATERLHRLVESLLDFGRMEAGRRPYRFERIDAGLLVRDLVEEFRGELDGRDLTVAYSVDSGELLVDADPEALARAVWNLLDNAVKYSGDSRTIDVAVSQTADRIAIAVRDRGIGIPAAEQARIFHKFTRGATATSRRIRGTGIGLAMVQHIVSAHNGTLGVESVEDQGSRFTIALPAWRNHPEAVSPEPLERETST